MRDPATADWWWQPCGAAALDPGAAGHRPAGAKDGGLECPASITDPQGTSVPAKPQGVDGRPRLLPDRQPVSLVDCAYPLVHSGAATPTGPPFAGAKRTLITGDRIDDVVGLLAWAPRDTGRPRFCTLIAGAQTVHLLGARYEDAIVWVASLAEPNRCKPATNGDFRSSMPVGYQLEEWFGTHGFDASPQGVCEQWVGGRLGDDLTLAPDGAPAVTVCGATNTGQDAHQLSIDQSRQVVAALRSLSPEPSDQTCTGATADGSRDFRLVLDYGRGADVIINVIPGCDPELLGSTLSARDAGPVIALVEQWSKPPGYDPNRSVSSTGTS